MILIFLVFIVLTSFGINNVIIGVFVDNTMHAAQVMQTDDDAKEKVMKIQLLERIRVMIFALQRKARRWYSRSSRVSSRTTPWRTVTSTCHRARRS